MDGSKDAVAEISKDWKIEGEIIIFTWLGEQELHNLKREKRPPFTFKSGAIYDGEWKGHVRDGYGVQIWPDGAKYEGF